MVPLLTHRGRHGFPIVALVSHPISGIKDCLSTYRAGKDRKLFPRNAMELSSAEIPSHEKPRKIHSFEDVLTGHSARCRIREENAHTFFEVRIGSP